MRWISSNYIEYMQTEITEITEIKLYNDNDKNIENQLKKQVSLI